MDNMTPQLLEEIQKIKLGDYSSYQTFYSATVQPLFAAVWEIIQQQDDANIIIEALYNYIYANINNELDDNNKFFDWAREKAVSMATAYATSKKLASPGVPFDSNPASMMNGTNQGFGQAPAGNGNAMMGQAPTGNANVTMGQAATGNGNAMMGQAATGNANAAMGQAASGGAKVATGTLAKTGLSIGAKIAIGIASAVVVTGIGFGVYTLVKPDHKDSETTAATTEFLVEENTETTEPVTEADITEEVTSEEPVDDTLDEATVARYAAYYDVVKPYMEQFSTEIFYSMSGGESIDGIRFVDLIDFNGDGNKQLVIAYKDNSDYANPMMLDIYDYVDGSAVLLESINCGRHTGDYGTQSICVLEDRGKKVLWVLETGMNRAMPAESFYTRVTYSDANELEIHTFSDAIVSDFYYDGNEIDADTYQGYGDIRNGEIQMGMSYPYGESGISFGNYMEPNGTLAKALLVKHRAIELMASCAGDSAFLEESDVAFEIVDEGYYENLLELSTNKYNEVYKISTQHDDVFMNQEISSDGKTVHIYENDEIVSSYSQEPYQVDADMYFAYVEDAVVMVGRKRNYYKETADNNYEPCIEYNWYTPDDYINDSMDSQTLSKYAISEDVYNENAQELMTR